MAIINSAGSNDKSAFVQGLLSALSDFYIKNPDTNLGKLYQALANVLVESDIEISSLLHDNFLSANVLEESKVRGEENLDKLDNEGAFKINRVGFLPLGTIVREKHAIDTTDTVVTLDSTPEDFATVSVIDAEGNPATTVLSYDESLNTVTVAGIPSAPGLYTFRYTDKGNTKTETEHLTIPAELFDLGWGQGGFGKFGFGL